MTCPAGTILCLDGNCYDLSLAGGNCTAVDAAYDVNPCTSTCGFACPTNVWVGNSDECITNVTINGTSMYDAATAGFCATEEVAAYISYTLPGFIIGYAWFATVCGLSLLYMFLNQRIFPHGEVIELEERKDTNNAFEEKSAVEGHADKEESDPDVALVRFSLLVRTAFLHFAFRVAASCSLIFTLSC